MRCANQIWKPEVLSKKNFENISFLYVCMEAEFLNIYSALLLRLWIQQSMLSVPLKISVHLGILLKREING